MSLADELAEHVAWVKYIRFEQIRYLPIVDCEDCWWMRD